MATERRCRFNGEGCVRISRYCSPSPFPAVVLSYFRIPEESCFRISGGGTQPVRTDSGEPVVEIVGREGAHERAKRVLGRPARPRSKCAREGRDPAVRICESRHCPKYPQPFLECFTFFILKQGSLSLDKQGIGSMEPAFGVGNLGIFPPREVHFNIR